MLFFVITCHKIIGSPVSILSCVKVWPRIWIYAMTIYFLPPPLPLARRREVRTRPCPLPTALWEEFLVVKPSINTGFKWKVLQFSIAATGSVAVMVLISSSSSATYHLFNIPWDRVSWVFLLAVTCLSRSLGCLKSFFGFHLSPFGHHSSRPTSLPDHHKNHLIWVDTSLMAPIELLLVTTHAAQPPDDYLKNHLIWLDSIQIVPLGFHVNSTGVPAKIHL
jgi:hypothetical protein